MNDIFEPSPKKRERKLLRRDCKPKLFHSELFMWLIHSSMVKTPFWVKIKELFSIQTDKKKSTLTVFLWKSLKLEVIWLFYTSATIGQVSFLRLPMRLSSDPPLLPNTEGKLYVSMYTQLHQRSCYAHRIHKDKNKDIVFFSCAIISPQ